MHTAPAVSVQLDPEPRWRAGLATLSLLAPLVAGIGCAHHLLNTFESWPVWQTGLAAVLLSLTGWAALCCWRLRTPQCANLEWNGIQWQATDLSGTPSLGDVTVVIDLGAWMLLRFDPHAGVPSNSRSARWLAVSEHGLPQQWHALRCAVHAPPATQPERQQAHDR